METFFEPEKRLFYWNDFPIVARSRIGNVVAQAKIDEIISVLDKIKNEYPLGIVRDVWIDDKACGEITITSICFYEDVYNALVKRKETDFYRGTETIAKMEQNLLKEEMPISVFEYPYFSDFGGDIAAYIQMYLFRKPTDIVRNSDYYSEVGYLMALYKKYLNKIREQVQWQV